MRRGVDEYPTQKPEALLTSRDSASASDPGDLVLDCFIGSGTTAAVAQKLGRRWIACDINKGAIQTTAKRLMADHRRAGRERQTAQRDNPCSTRVGEPEPVRRPPAQLSFAVYRVNDYDLANPAQRSRGLACEHIGVTRSRSDAFFDGTLGQAAGQNHPLRPPRHPARPGRGQARAGRPSRRRPRRGRRLPRQRAGSDAWLEDWNRLRKRGDVPNKIEVIELRTDTRYGGFIAHQPADARVTVSAPRPTRLRITILDFISPAIVERLKQQANLLNPQIDDWRAMVDSVMIDAAYDGQTFNVTLADVPAEDRLGGGYLRVGCAGRCNDRRRESDGHAGRGSAEADRIFDG